VSALGISFGCPFFAQAIPIEIMPLDFSPAFISVMVIDWTGAVARNVR
jgi:hypothetical protein